VLPVDFVGVDIEQTVAVLPAVTVIVSTSPLGHT
jgi:hypothetical protein